MLIIGGSRGIGAALARLAAGGYNVAFTYNHSAERARELEDELKEKGSVKAIFCDAESENSIASAVASAIARFGKIDTLVYCSGISQNKLFTDITLSEWRKMFAVNLDGAFLCAREACKDMISRQCGSIVFITSIWGETGGSTETHYSASKAGLIGLCKSLAKELAPSGIRVNCVSPGAIDTDMMKEYSPDERAAFIEEIPLGRLGLADEAAKAILYLDGAEYITGEVLRINGGYLI